MNKGFRKIKFRLLAGLIFFIIVLIYGFFVFPNPRKVKKHFPKKYCKIVNKFSKRSQSFKDFVGGTSGFATVVKRSGYAGVLTSSLYLANMGVQNNTKIYKKAAKKGTGVTVSYDLYVPKTGGNYSLVRNQKVVYK